MPRKKTVHRISPLPAGPKLRHDEHKTEKLLGILTKIATANQREEPQAFYPQRDVALRFGVPLSLTAKVYRKLEREGILRSIRGSGTFLEGRTAKRKLKVRGLIALPSSLPSFLARCEDQAFLLRVVRALHRRDFATTVCFFSKDDTGDDLLRRLVASRPDIVLWYGPARFAREVTLRLRDGGIRVVGISDGGDQSIRCQYEIDRRSALREVMRKWKRQQINSVKVVLDTKRPTTVQQNLPIIANELEVGISLVTLMRRKVGSFLERLEGGAGSGIILCNAAASLLAARRPTSLAALASHARLAFADGPIHTPWEMREEAVADLVTVDWRVVANRIIADLIKQEVPSGVPPFRFEAKAVFRVPLSSGAKRV